MKMFNYLELKSGVSGGVLKSSVTQDDLNNKTSKIEIIEKCLT